MSLLSTVQEVRVHMKACTCRADRLLASVGAAALVVAGCASAHDGSHPDHGSVAYVLGVHANAPASADADKLLSEAVDQQQVLTVVAVDGEPRIATSIDLLSAAQNPDSRQREEEQQKYQLRAALAGLQPKTAEVDLLAGIALGARSLNHAPKTMVVEDSGVSTKGVLRFQQPGMPDADPNEVADSLQRQGELPPDLKGVNVVLRGFGDVVLPQQALGIAKRNNVIAIWKAVLTRAGANVSVDDTPRQGNSWPDNAPAVTPIPIAESPLPSVVEPVALPAAEYFEPDSGRLIDADRAVEVLRPFAEEATRSGADIDLIGTTARDGDRDGQIQLSRQRAEVLKTLLVEQLNVPADKVTTDGVGSYGPTYVPDHDAAGNLLPAAAAQNRTVWISIHKEVAP
jgi:outer membrane protein OmpA-like peptidoglycan-associated protein